MEKIFNQYVLARYNVQLKEAILERINVEKIDDEISKGDHSINIVTTQKSELLNTEEISGYLKTIVKVINVNTNVTVLLIEVIYKGLFIKIKDIDVEEFKELTDVIIVSQLLPYVRTMISFITNQMMIQPINIPTMDVLESMKINLQDLVVEEENDDGSK